MIMRFEINRIFTLIAAFLVSMSAFGQYRTDAGYQDLYDSETGGSLKAHVRSLSAAHLEGRRAGSEGEKTAAEYVRTVLKDYGVDVISPEGGDLFGIKTEAGDTLASRNVIGFVQGYDKELRNRYILVGARLDNLGTMTVTIEGR